jgi:hypothetical protein
MPTNQEVSVWAAEIAVVAGAIGSRFSRHDLRTRAESYLRGLISRVGLKNGSRDAASNSGCGRSSEVGYH